MKKVMIWIKSAAGVVSICLLVVSILLLVLGCFSWESLSERWADSIRNILFGLGTNLVGIIITVSFVQFFLDKQNTKAECVHEREEILRFDKIMQILIRHYTMYFNTITTPMKQRDSISITELKDEFTFADLQDLYKQSLFLRNKGYEPAIIAFYDAELELRKYCMEFTSQVGFKYNHELLNVLTQIVEVSLAFDVRSAVIGNISLSIGTKKYTDVICEYIADTSQNWVSKIHDEKSVGNIMTPYVNLFDLLNLEKALILQYRAIILTLGENTEK